MGIRGTLASVALVSRLCGGQELFSKETGSIYSSISIYPVSKYSTENPTNQGIYSFLLAFHNTHSMCVWRSNYKAGKMYANYMI